MTKAAWLDHTSKLNLSFGVSDNVRTRPLVDGLVSPEGIRLIPSIVHPSELVWRQLHFGDFDISEMSLSTLFISVAHGDPTWVGLPIYAAPRRFPHTGIRVRIDSGIEIAADLRGKKIGLPEYQQTSAMWTRGILQHEFDVHPKDIDWYIERPADKSHGGATGFEPPPGVHLNQVLGNTNIGEMVVNKELDGVLVYLNERNLVDRSQINLSSVPEVRRLFPEPELEGRRYFAKTGIFPMNRAVVVRRTLLERHPWIALNIYSAFLQAKELATKQLYALLQPYFEIGRLDESVLTDDPMAYGLRAARPALEMAAQFVYEQGLTSRLVGVEELFASCTHDL